MTAAPANETKDEDGIKILGLEIGPHLWEDIQAGAAKVLLFIPQILLTLLLLLIGFRIVSCFAGCLRSRLVGGSINGKLDESDGDLSDDSMTSRSARSLKRLKTQASLSPEIVNFIVSLFENSAKVFLVIICAGMIGIETTSFVAILAASSLAIGLALQGLLKDFAAGVLLVIFRPYRVGDLVEAAEEKGRVQEVGMFETTLLSLDNKTIIIPNSKVSTVTNLSAQSKIRIDVPIKISHKSNLSQAKQVLQIAAEKCPCALPDPSSQVLVSEVNELGRTLFIRAWVLSADYVTAPFTLLEQALYDLDSAGIALASLDGVYSYPTKSLQASA